MAKSNVTRTKKGIVRNNAWSMSRKIKRILEAPSDDPRCEAEVDAIFGLCGGDPTDEETDVIFSSKLTFAEKMAQLKVLHKKGGVK
jgi:hypothetical protein